MVKEPEVGFMQATYWQLWTSFRVSFCLSYLRRGGAGRGGVNIAPQAQRSPLP